MISVTRLDGREFTLNADLIESIESNPDTFIRLVNGDSFIVLESRGELVERIIAYRRQIFQCAISLSPEDATRETALRRFELKQPTYVPEQNVDDEGGGEG